MKKRPLCFMCLTFLLVKGILLIAAGGQGLVNVPASSIFSENSQQKEILVCGQVYKKAITSNIQILYLKNNSIYSQGKTYQESKILIYDDTFHEIPIGKTVSVRGSTQRFEGARNPGNFDQQLYYAKQDIYGYLWFEEIVEVSGKENTFKEFLYQLKQGWKLILEENLSEENSGVLSAILLSEKSELDVEIKEQYQKNGISHVLSISGLHISFLGMGFYQMLRKRGVSFGVSGTISFLILSMYVMMIGFSVSVIRAYIMLILRIGADLSGRVYDITTALLLAAVIIVGYQPLYLTDAGFYLSHGAVCGIVWVLPQLKKMFPIKWAWLENGYASIAVNIALFPLMLWFYYEVSMYSVLINMMILPLMTWVLSLGMFGSASYFLCRPLGTILLKACDWILTFFDWGGKMGGMLPFARVVFGKPEMWVLILYYILLAAFLLFTTLCSREEVMKKSRKFWVAAGLAGTLLFWNYPNGKLQITMIDVGQGDSIFVRGPSGNNYLIDGGSSDVDEVGRYRIEPFLKSQGVGTLDYVFVTHGDSDHYSGILEMVGRQKFGVKIDMLVLPVNYQKDSNLQELATLAQENGIRVAVIQAGQSIVEKAMGIRCVQPDYNMKELNSNEGSLVLEISFGNFDMLLTGDVENEGEEILLQNLSGKSYDVLKVAHHGSKNSTTAEFLQTVKPKIALISAGKNNSYGHPHAETVTRLQKQGCGIYQTLEQGAVILESDGDFIDIFPSSI